MSDQIEREQQIEEESLTKNSLQIQKAAWIREELEKRRAQEDQLLQQILREQQMLQELDEDMDQNMAHAKEGRRYREDMKARVDDRVYEMHDLSADKREGMREWFSFRWRCVCLPGICMASLPRHALYLCFLPEYRQPFWYIKNSARSSGSLSVMCFLR